MIKDDEAPPTEASDSSQLDLYCLDENASLNALNLHLGMTLESFRLGRSISQEQLAEALRITSADVAAYENGTRRIPPIQLVAMAKLLDHPLSAFFGGIV